MKKVLSFIILMVCAVTGAWADDLSGGGSYTVADGVVTFSGTTVGAISGESSFNFNGATRIKFDNTCEINQADLEKFLQGNTYYVDLFDITNGSGAKMHVEAYPMFQRMTMILTLTSSSRMLWPIWSPTVGRLKASFCR